MIGTHTARSFSATTNCVGLVERHDIVIIKPRAKGPRRRRLFRHGFREPARSGDRVIIDRVGTRKYKIIVDARNAYTRKILLTVAAVFRDAPTLKRDRIIYYTPRYRATS